MMPSTTGSTELLSAASVTLSFKINLSASNVQIGASADMGTTTTGNSISSWLAGQCAEGYERVRALGDGPADDVSCSS